MPPYLIDRNTINLLVRLAVFVCLSFTLISTSTAQPAAALTSRITAGRDARCDQS
jgi:hypothetical protein